ncbi:hypothetical protein EDEG_01390 [Edhazardia aedis USNM 41457]|uniref:Uncharacterized protein n=1 Tax=Edhazardia aedis (strain USNM 41457) TaxID=1003232 RepID=J9DPA3_EDHAE|nr:hypothetical protein EDEG_01390 [Edhazardia aedis USNM 41457]|eukprot:EJW04375.1 hypothetical protein EDEG_01390 [Edhazardia aedis USNM 41457]
MVIWKYILFYASFTNSIKQYSNIESIFCYNIDSLYIEKIYLSILENELPKECYAVMNLEKFKIVVEGISDVLLDIEIYRDLLFRCGQNFLDKIVQKVFPFDKKANNKPIWIENLGITTVNTLENVQKIGGCISFHKILQNLKYMDFLNIYTFVYDLEEDKFENLKLFKSKSVDIYNLFIKDLTDLLLKFKIKLCKNRFLGKFLIDCMSLRINPEIYKFITDGMKNDLVKIHAMHSSLYTDNQMLISYIKKIVFNSDTLIKNTTIYFQCCSDLLIAEILANSYDNDRKKNVGKDEKKILENQLENIIIDFCNGVTEIKNNTLSFSANQKNIKNSEIKDIEKIFY